MKGFVSGSELMKGWGISPYEFLERFLKKGLIAYNIQGRELSPQELFNGVEDPSSDVDKIMAWKSVELPGSDELAQQMLTKLGDLYFDETNVKSMEAAFDLPAGKKWQEPARPKSVHHTVKDKMRVQAKARELKDGKYKEYTAPELAITPEIRKAATKSNGTAYSKRKRTEWINEILTEDEKLKGRPQETD